MPPTRAQILHALKATAPAVTASGGYGAVTPPYLSPGPSPLVASYNEWTSGRATSGNSAALPRDWQTFLSGMFGPLAPIQPSPVDVPDDGDPRPEPRRRQAPVGWNMPMGMPGTERWGKLASFDTLRTIADSYSVARACIELRKSELRGIGWDIAPTKDAAKAMRGNPKAMADFAARRTKAVKFFKRPDPDYADFTSWFDSVLEEVFVTDALSIYPHPARLPGKGALGSDVAALTQIDGTLIRPLLNVRGSKPKPPNVAYQQYLYGVPRTDLMSVINGDDLADAGMDTETLAAEYRGDQLIYAPLSPRVWSPYGQAPIERALIPVLTGLRRQQYQLDYYDQGSIPGLFVSPGDSTMNPAQIRELQDALNALAGDAAWKHKIIVLPGGSKVDPQRPASLADQFDEIIMASVCMAFNVMPMELGISPKVSATQSSGAANQMAKSSQDIQERKGTVPLLTWMANTIFNFMLQDVCGQEDMEWQWEGLEEDEDAETLTSLLVQQVGAGLRSIDEGRAELGLDPWGLPATSDPGWATQATGFMPFTAAASPINAPPPAPPLPPGQQRPALPPGQSPEPGQPAQPGKPNSPASTSGTSGSSGTSGTNNSGGQAATPAHAAAQAATGSSSTSSGSTSSTGSTSSSTSSPASGKGATRELDLLRAHLRKGGLISTWQPRDLTQGSLSRIARSMAEGLDPDLATSLERAWLTRTPAPASPATRAVHAYLARTYPETALSWVDATEWDGPRPVPLDKISGARRAGGARDPAKIQAISQQIADGKEPDPIITVTPGDGGQLLIADGWHRYAAAKATDATTIAAWVGHLPPGGGGFDPAEMGRAKLNKAGGGDGEDPKVWPGWEHDQQLTAAYKEKLTAAYTAALREVRVLLRRRHTTASAVAGQVRDIITRHLGPVLGPLWAEAWHLGSQGARIITGQAAGWGTWKPGDPATLPEPPPELPPGPVTGTPLPPGDPITDGPDLEEVSSLQELLESYGITEIKALGGAGLDDLEEAITEAVENGDTAETLATAIEGMLAIPSRAGMIAVTEIARAMSAASLSSYRLFGVTMISWVTAGPGGPVICQTCLTNEAAGPIRIGQSFPSGDPAPPAHPFCRCAVTAAAMPGVNLLTGTAA